MRLYLSNKFFFLKVYDACVYGYILIFDKDGNFINSINSGGGEVIKCFIEGAFLNELTEKIGTDILFSDKNLITFVDDLVSKKVLLYEKQSSLPTWIDAKEEHTLLTKEASNFSCLFSNYISSVFHDGTFLIDSHKEFLPHLKKYLSGIPQKGLAIDIGCGSGYYSDFLLKQNLKVVSTDVSLDRLRVLKTRSKDQNEFNSRPVVSDALRLPFKDKQFDLILCIFVLEHVTDIDTFLTEIARIARYNARLIIAFPSISLKEAVMIALNLKKPALLFEHFHLFGLFSSKIPFCKNIKQIIRKLEEEKIKTKKVMGKNILGINSSNKKMNRLFRFLNKIFGSFYPFNLLGEQTIIIGNKK